MIARYAIPFFLAMSLIVVPAAVALLCRFVVTRRWRGRAMLVSTVAIWGIVAYGLTVGFQQFRVQHVELSFSDLPDAFDGYRIVQFSDAHVGTFTGSRQWLLQRAVDSINAQKPDAIVFTGDLMNLHPDELRSHVATLARLHARDGVFSVLGNHDYPMYLSNATPDEKKRFSQQTRQLERQMGWTLLLNEHRIVRRGTDSLCMAGMENWGKVERMPRKGDVARTLEGVDSTAFTVMLQHDPTAWRALILPDGRARLTLSGHTHGGQMALRGWSPVTMAYDEWGGTYCAGSRVLHVSTGLGGLIPFRLGLPGEIVVITLRSKHANK